MAGEDEKQCQQLQIITVRTTVLPLLTHASHSLIIVPGFLKGLVKS